MIYFYFWLDVYRKNMGFKNTQNAAYSICMVLRGETPKRMQTALPILKTHANNTKC